MHLPLDHASADHHLLRGNGRLYGKHRISVPAEDREYILYDIVQKGFLGYPKKNNTQCLIVNFINDEDEAVLTLDEIDCQELAYIYLNWKNDGKGYTRCQKCNRLIKQSKNGIRKYCELCRTEVETENKSLRNAKYYASHKN